MSDIDDFVKRRNKALLTMDMEYLREVLPEASSDFIREAAGHKARYEIVGMPPELRHASGNWLRKHGLGRSTGSDLLPEGELPL